MVKLKSPALPGAPVANDVNALSVTTTDDKGGMRPEQSKDALKFADHLAEPDPKEAAKAKASKAPIGADPAMVDAKGQTKADTKSQAKTAAKDDPKALPKTAADAATAKAGGKTPGKDDAKTTKELVGRTASINNNPKPVPQTAPKVSALAKSAASVADAAAKADSAQQTSSKDTKDDRAAKSNTLVVKKSGLMTAPPKDDGDAKETGEVLDAKDHAKSLSDNSGKAVTAAPTAIADAKDANQPESWEKRLEDMLEFMGLQPSAMPRAMPALALLTGQVQDVAPESIPATIAQSPMINNVLAADDPATVVEEVKPLGQWLGEMGWSPDTVKVQDPAAFKALMATPVALKDLMKSFDVDPNRVVTEARIMQDTLPMEGATPYIERSTRLRAEAGIFAATPKAEPAGATKATAPQADAKDDDAAMELEFLGMLMNRGNDPMGPRFDSAKDATDAINTASLKSLKETGRPLTTVDQLLADASSVAGQGPNLDGLPKVRTVSDNPFQTLELRSSETFTFKPEMLRAEGASGRGERRDWLEGIHSIQLQNDTDLAGFGEGPKSLDSQNFFEPLQAMPVMPGSGDFQGSSSDSDSEGGDLEHGVNEFAHVSHNQQTGHTQGATFDLGGADAAVPTHAAKEVVKHVFDNSTMLVEKGGGSIRLDIGNKELGAIDLAIEVKDNKVDIKIVAASPHAREVLATELPKLKESLQNQNLNLSKVEIGLSGGSSWTSSDGRSQQRETSSQSEEISGVGGTTSTRKSSRSYRQSSQAQSLQPDAPGAPSGSIHVRV